MMLAALRSVIPTVAAMSRSRAVGSAAMHARTCAWFVTNRHAWKSLPEFLFTKLCYSIALVNPAVSLGGGVNAGALDARNDSFSLGGHRRLGRRLRRGFHAVVRLGRRAQERELAPGP